MSSIISWFIRKRSNLCIKFIKEGGNISILVTGGSGFIGSHIVDKLLENNFHVKVFDIIPPIQKNVEFIKGDIKSLNSLTNAMSDVEYVYHIAAVSNINNAMDDPLKTIDINILSTAKVLEASRNSHIKRIIYASSYFVGIKKGNIYTTTKLVSEMICKNYYDMYGLPFTILRYGTAYGPRSREEDVISIFVKRALSNKSLIIEGDGNQSRNFIYVTDIADGNVAALNDIANNKTYILEGLEQTTIKEIAEKIKKVIGNVTIEYQKSRKNDYDKIILNNENKAKKELNWQPKINIEKGIEKYIKWYKNE